MRHGDSIARDDKERELIKLNRKAERGMAVLDMVLVLFEGQACRSFRSEASHAQAISKPTRQNVIALRSSRCAQIVEGEAGFECFN